MARVTGIGGVFFKSTGDQQDPVGVVRRGVTVLSQQLRGSTEDRYP